MIDVSATTKQAWASGLTQKKYSIYFEGGYCDNAHIIDGSVNMSESILSSDSLEFVGCISRKFEFKTDMMLNMNLKGKIISCSCQAGMTEHIPLFYGYIDESKKEGMKGFKKIVAYDLLYSLSKVDATDWWNNLGAQTLISAFNKLTRDFSIPCSADVTFVNATMMCFGGIFRKVKQLSVLDVLKQICQINGCMGYMNPNGAFAVKYINATRQLAVYPSDSIFPNDYIYPSDYQGGGVTPTALPYYQSLEYEDYTVKLIDQVIVRNTSEDIGVCYPYTGNNGYIIQGNIFAFNQTGTALLHICENIYNVVKNANFRPFRGKQMSYPWIETGDSVTYYDIDDEGNSVDVTFLIMSRIVSGGGMLWDTFSAEGNEEQDIFITDLNAQLADLQEQIDSVKETPDGSLYGMVSVEYTTPIETPTLGGYEDTVNGIATEV